MKTTLSSRERLLTAIALQEPDHVPLWNLWNHSRDPFNPRDPLARVDAVLALGLDDSLVLEPPWRIRWVREGNSGPRRKNKGWHEKVGKVCRGTSRY